MLTPFTIFLFLNIELQLILIFLVISSIDIFLRILIKTVEKNAHYMAKVTFFLLCQTVLTSQDLRQILWGLRLIIN